MPVFAFMIYSLSLCLRLSVSLRHGRVLLHILGQHSGLRQTLQIRERWAGAFQPNAALFLLERPAIICGSNVREGR
jgi:hypothetical protein